jgi:predicted glycosyltransferase
VAACAALAPLFPRAAFDVVAGPGAGDACERLPAAPNLRVSREARDLEARHLAADVVVTGGGYNSLVEAVCGRARVVCWPLAARTTDEKHVHPARLAAHYPVRVVDDAEGLRAAVRASLEEVAREGAAATDLDLGGVERFRSLLFRDLGIAADAPPPPSAGAGR